jgi:flagellar M-ring protein FliF
MAGEPGQIQGQIAAMSMSQKIIALVGVAGAMAGMVVLFLWANQPNYALLYSNLSPEDAGAVVEKLKAQKIPYKVSGPDAVMVPEDRVYELRLQMASEGLPQGGAVGFELFDKNSMGMTDFVQKLNYRRGLEGELAKTIGQLTEVHQARVHLMIPERTLFSEKQESSSASVVLKLRGGNVLSEGQVQGIVHLVASSVEGLSPEKITVVDTHGTILSRSTDASYGAQMSNYQMEYQRNLEKGLEERVESMLDRAVGAGKVIARVSSVLNFKQVETTEEKYDPDGQVVRSEQRAQENTSGSSTASGGVPGVLSNLPGAKAENPQAATGKGASSQGKKSSETINYDISKSVSRIVEPTGSIKQISVAVLIDGTYAAGGGTDQGTAGKYTPRTAEEMKKYEDIVKKAVGFNTDRGDQVEVVNTPFETNVPGGEETAPAPSTVQKFTFLLPFLKYGVAGIAVILLFLLVIKPMMKTLLAPNIPAISAALVPRGGMSMTELEQRGSYPQIAGEGEVKDQVGRIIRENPQQAAKLLKSWIGEK